MLAFKMCVCGGVYLDGLLFEYVGVSTKINTPISYHLADVYR